MDAKTLEVVLPIVNALKTKGVEQWKALEIAAQCMPHIDLIDGLVGRIVFETDTRFSESEVLALIAECLKAPDDDAGRADSPNTSAVDQELVRRLAMPIACLNLSRRIRNCLRNIRGGAIACLLDLVGRPEREILALNGFGRRSYREMREKLDRFDLKLGMTFDRATVSAVREEIAQRIDAETKRAAATDAQPR